MTQSGGKTRWSVRLGQGGLRYRPDPTGALDGRLLEPVLAQWSDEGLAAQGVDDWYVDWSSLYEVIDGRAYDDVLEQVGVPSVAEVVPALSSRGALSDPDFTIAIAGWHWRDGKPVDRISVDGAVVRLEGEERLLSRGAFDLLTRVREFLHRPADARDSRSQRLA